MNEHDNGFDDTRPLTGTAGATLDDAAAPEGAEEATPQVPPVTSAGADPGMTPPYAGPSYPTQQPYQPASEPSPQPQPATGPYAGPCAGPYAGSYAGYPVPERDTLVHPVTPGAPVRRGPGRWFWPAVASLALVVGLVGGAVGGVVVDSYRDNQNAGTSSDGLDLSQINSQAPLDPVNGSVAAVAQQLLPSTVQILADYNGEHLGATGSGFVLDKLGHIVTNNHVIAGAADGGDIEVIDHNGHREKATLVGRSTVYDLAVLYVPSAKKLKPASLGASEALNVGDGVVAIGSPLGLSETVTAGIVSALNRPVTTGESEDATSYINAVQTDAAINPGNSGGPLVNMAGQVVGVNSAIATTGGSTLGGESGNIGVGFAIPIEQVLVTADQIIATGHAEYPLIGAKVQTGDSNTGGGAVIESVDDGTPADKAGLQAGDVVTSLDGDTITDGVSLIVAIRTHQPGDTIDMVITRDGKEKTLSVTLDGQEG